MSTTDGHTQRLEAALSGRYRVQRKLGEGGMASVYLAEDLKHERKVAIKVLRPELAAVLGAERFLAEIKTTANLQHPHILPLFDSGEADGFLYYVMPYIEGESLRERLEREGQLGVEDAVRIARDVADALDYAHRNDIIHRDIKPANILLHDGRPVVADFGIALAISAAGGGRMTETGLSLGTPHYMSPEQASADRDLTARSDVYSLGCVLYEMLAGQPPHTGPSAQSILVRILTEDPREVTELRRTVPPHVAATVMKAIEKLPADRFDAAGDFKDALDDPGFTHTVVPRGAAGPGTAHGSEAGWGRWTLVAMAAIPALLVGAALGRGWGAGGGEPAFDRDAPVVRMAFDSAMGVQYAGYIDISNDGSTLAYTAQGGIHIVELDGPRRRILPGTQRANGVVFSSDGSELVFFMEPGLYRIPVAGGPPILLLERPLSIPGEWASDGTLYFSGVDGLYRLPPEGEPERMVGVGFPEVVRMTEVPGGRWLLYSRRAQGGSDPGELRILDLESMESRTLLQGGFDPQYAMTGHVVYTRNDQSVLVVGFDAEAGEVVGRPFAVLDSLALPDIGLAPMALSRTGSLFYVRGPSLGNVHNRRFALLSGDGDLDVLPIPEADLSFPELSPGGEHLAFFRESHVVVHDLGTGAETTLPARLVAGLTWSDDGDRIVYTRFGGESGGGSHIGIWRWREGATAREIPIDRPGLFFMTDFTPDGRFIGFLSNSSTQSDILIADTAGTLTPYLNASWSESDPLISPDGAWVAYTSDESGTREVYVRAYPTPGERYDISGGPGRNPAWAPDGNLYFARGDSLWLVELSLDPEPAVRSRRPVLGRERAEGRIDIYSVTAGPDGGLIAQITPLQDEEADAEPQRPRVAWIVANWFTELLERAGGGGS